MAMLIGTVGFAGGLLMLVLWAMGVAIKALEPEDDIASPEDVVSRLGALSQGDAFTAAAVTRTERKHRRCWRSSRGNCGHGGGHESDVSRCGRALLQGARRPVDRWPRARTWRGAYAWRTRVSECHRQLGMDIENTVRSLPHTQRKVSLYRYVPPRPVVPQQPTLFDVGAR